jgi:carbamoyl-phosphate synthase large subunit
MDRGRTANDPALIDLGRACTQVFRFLGPINIQCRVANGAPSVFEINPRFSGGIPLTIAAGADFARWLIDLALNRPLPQPLAPFTPNLWVTNYEEGIFLGEERLAALRPTPRVRGR